MTSQPTTYRHGEPSVYQAPTELAKVTRALRAGGRRIALVPTMGALHAGHQELIRRARRIPGAVVAVSIFVNPLQFGPNEDLAAYPRPFDADLDVCARAGVELVFHPDVADLYPDGGVRVSLDPGPLGRELEGAVRPGHFAGVLTVVAKLFNIVRPDYAFFGEKDYQQLILIRRMVADLNLDVAVVGVPTVREDGGLALSSRNRYLDADGREAALTLSAALSAGVYAGADGPAAARAAAASVLAQRPDVDVDYLELRGDDLGPVPPTGPARLLVAARVGATRLIDNAPVLLASQETGQREKGQ